ncbi:transporter [Paenibacillus sp. KQZ6P-2]|uniref:Transporter n=1 Tax=Paenibacillus mangrovi TaxID=2931978 RepID=A0A9X2B4Y2_9BACL|nr:transporter [Paenibacillus mangrovi]MCJ8012107.1 transporter [Paenibacillus mangrovi]
MAFMPPFGPQGQLQPPSSPPPQFTPPQPAATTFAVDPGAIRGCMFRNTYIWLNNGNSFWFFPVFVGQTSVAGFRWTGFFWVYTGISLRQIQSFTCF